MSFFEKTSITFRAGTKERINKWVVNNPDLYDNVSHFVRCAVIREEKRLSLSGRSSKTKHLNSSSGGV